MYHLHSILYNMQQIACISEFILALSKIIAHLQLILNVVDSVCKCQLTAAQHIANDVIEVLEVWGRYG